MRYESAMVWERRESRSSYDLARLTPAKLGLADPVEMTLVATVESDADPEPVLPPEPESDR